MDPEVWIQSGLGSGRGLTVDAMEVPYSSLGEIRRRRTEMPDILTMLEEINEVAEDVCSEWEYEFMQSVTEQYEERGSLSEKQEEILERIYKKACDSDY